MAGTSLGIVTSIPQLPIDLREGGANGLDSNVSNFEGTRIDFGTLAPDLVSLSAAPHMNGTPWPLETVSFQGIGTAQGNHAENVMSGGDARRTDHGQEATARANLHALNQQLVHASFPDAALSAFYHGQIGHLPTLGTRDVDRFIDEFLRHRVRDLSLRDGHQSLDGNRWTIEEREQIALLLDLLGLHSIEAGGGADFEVATIIGENPFQNQRRFNLALPSTEQQWLFRGRNALGLMHQPQDVIVAMVEYAIQNGLKKIRVFDGMNDMDNIRSTVEAVLAIRERMGDAPESEKPKVEGAIAYTTDDRDVPPKEKVWSIEVFVELAKIMKAMGVHSIAIKDMAGKLTEEAVEKLVVRLHQEVGLPISVHSHSSTGRATGVLIKALETAARIGAQVVIDTAIGDLSGGTSHPDIRDILKDQLRKAGFTEEEYRDNFKIRLLDKIAQLIAMHAAKYKPSRIAVDEEMSRLLDLSGIPGGMVGTTARMITPNLLEGYRQIWLRRHDMGEDDNVPGFTVEYLIKEGLKRVPQVRADAGLPPLVTPMSQFVLIQAIFNFVYGDYVMIHPQYAAMMKGRFGKVRGKPNEELLRRFSEEGDSPKPLEPEMPALLEQARELISRYHLDINPTEAALILVAVNGHDLLTGKTAKGHLTNTQ